MRIFRLIRNNLLIVSAGAVAYLLSTFQDTLRLLAKNVFGDELVASFYLLALAVSLVVFLGLLEWGLRHPKSKVPEDRLPPKLLGLIVLVGKKVDDDKSDKQSAKYAIQYHLKDAQGNPGLRVCWLIASDDSLAYANELKGQFSKQVDMRVRKVDYAFELRYTYEVVSKIYADELRAANLVADQVIADFTGGTKPMSLGMAMACLPNDRQMQYMTGGKKDMASVPMLIKFKPG
jgi:hypothetical protein